MMCMAMHCRPVRVEAAGYNPFYNPRYKSTLCAHWQQGNCHKGNKCSFAHGAMVAPSCRVHASCTESLAVAASIIVHNLCMAGCLHKVS